MDQVAFYIAFMLFEKICFNDPHEFRLPAKQEPGINEINIPSRGSYFRAMEIKDKWGEGEKRRSGNGESVISQ